MVKDVHTGLIGPLLILRKGEKNKKGLPIDIDREFITVFTINNENESWLLERNIN